ncbi:Centromere protein V [Phytophthora citrophthora]|uniref:Centromere protein V n=1 Tax=Phytophthora citrophthora TaxID=4793 RepID=A0AAD9LSX4_9STRA|nr:Centromere protein V [Phytophthora citrophthora]
MTTEYVVHHGSCHCKAVLFDFDAPSDLVQTKCNCSICTMKQNAHAIVPKSRFRLLQGEDMLTLYTFNTHEAKHLFCKKCGVQAFYIPRSNPDGYAVTLSCVDPATITSITTETFDGQNWEKSLETSNITSYSKE